MQALGLTSPLSTTPRLHSSLAISFGGIRLGTNSVRVATAAPSESRGRLVAVRMGKRQTELTEIRGKNTEELLDEVVDLKGELLMQKLLWSARKDYDQGSIRRNRKRIARMMTVKREREIAEGIGKRMSRKLDKKWKRSIVPRPPPSLRKMLEESKESEENNST
ncbi:ribosomal L29 family protein [Carex rostrata]